MPGLMLTAMVLVDKRRSGHNESEVMNIIGEVEGKDIVVLDDMIDTGGTFVGAAEGLKKAGANKIIGVDLSMNRVYE